MIATQHYPYLHPFRSRSSLARALAWTVLLTFGLSGVLGLFGAAPAGAAPATRDRLPVFSLGCEFEAPGVATLFADRQGPELFAGSALWAPGTSPETDPPQLVSVDFTLTHQGNQVAGTLTMADAETFEPAGEMSFQAVLHPFGEPWSTDSTPERSGNILDRSYRTEQEATVEGVLVLPDGTQRSLDGCWGSVGEIVVRMNTPQKIVEHLPRISFGGCLVPGNGGYELGLLVLSEHGHTFADVAVFPPGDEDAVVFGFGDVDLGRKTLTATMPVFDDQGEPAGEAVIAATVKDLGPRIVKGQEGDVKFKLFARDFSLDGTVTVTNFGSFALDGCTGSHARGWLQYPNLAAGG